MTKQNTSRRTARVFAGVALSAALALGVCPAIPAATHADLPGSVGTAFAQPDLDALQKRIEETAQRYNEAQARSDALAATISETEGRIAELVKELPEQESRSRDAMRAHYRFQFDEPGLVSSLLRSTNLGEFLATFEYLTMVQQRYLDQIERTRSLKAELETKRETLLRDKQQVEYERAEARKALDDAQRARKEAEEQARREAEAQRARAEADLAAAKQQAAAAQQPAPAPSAPVIDGWASSPDKAAFVNMWAGRINAYLAGSPLAGQGATFASAAWDYGVDPRWSPAISTIESSKGAVCFRPHNAWGWGSSSWGSWEEAIRDHVAGLARGYGRTITPAAAAKYCPPNASHWYASVLAQMQSI